LRDSHHSSGINKKPGWPVEGLALAILLTGIAAKLSALSDGFYRDPFHHGEFVASLPHVLAGNMDFFTIHGGSDWLPAWFSYQVFGSASYFLPTLLLRAACDALASLCLYGLIAQWIGSADKYRTLILMVSAVLAFLVVGHRDLFLVLSIALYFLHERTSSRRNRHVLEIALGIALAVNLLWSFDRGLVGIAAVGSACLLRAVSEKGYRLAIGSLAASLLAMWWAGLLSFRWYVENIAFLLATASQWSYGYRKFVPLFLTAMVAIPNACALYYAGKQLLQAIRISRSETASLFLLMAATILMFRIATNRADAPHVVMALWMPALTFVHLRVTYAGKLSRFAIATVAIAMVWLAGRSHYYWYGVAAIVPAIYVIGTMRPGWADKLTSTRVAVAVVGIPLLLGQIAFVSWKHSLGGYVWMSRVSMLPANRSLVSEGVQWVSAALLTEGARCVFDLSNSGTINAIAGLPACTRFTYPVYANRLYEADLIRELQERNPPVVVFSSTDAHFSIDGKTMHERLPDLKEYLLKAYPIERCNFGYCLRTK
jgi:hypothetical protein